jgi:hypothetical protein
MSGRTTTHLELFSHQVGERSSLWAGDKRWPNGRCVMVCETQQAVGVRSNQVCGGFLTLLIGCKSSLPPDIALYAVDQVNRVQIFKFPSKTTTKEENTPWDLRTTSITQVPRLPARTFSLMPASIRCLYHPTILARSKTQRRGRMLTLAAFC